jgi:hypothetical protein
MFEERPSVYKAYSRQVCNFTFPEEIERPQPNKQQTDVEYQVNITKAINKLTDTHLVDELGKYSPKFEAIFNNLKKSPGTALIYSQFRVVEGIEILSKMLSSRGYEDMNLRWNGKKWSLNLSNTPKYAIFNNSGISDPTKKSEYINILLAIFNDEFEFLPDSIKKSLSKQSNLHGEVLKVLFITQSGAEGISLKNVRQVHVTEPFWNQNRVDQVIGRANRTNSHIRLPEKDRNFTSFTYIMKFSKAQLKTHGKNSILLMDKHVTTDQYVQHISTTKYRIITQFLDAMKKGSVDCLLNKSDDSCFVYPLYDKQSDNSFEINKSDKKYRPVVLNIKPINKSFLHVQETDELFDIDFFQKHKQFKKVGHLKQNKNGSTSVFLKQNVTVKESATKQPNAIKNKKDGESFTTSNKSSDSTTKSSKSIEYQWTYGKHFGAILYTKSALKLYNEFLDSPTAKKSDPKYKTLFSKIDNVYIEKPYNIDQASNVKDRIYEYRDVSADGNCFYHAVQLAMKETLNISVPNPIELRKKLADGSPNVVSENVRKRLLTDGVWAEDDEIHIFSKVYNVIVRVWVGETWVEYDKTDKQQKPKNIMLLLNGDGLYKMKKI